MLVVKPYRRKTGTLISVVLPMKPESSITLLRLAQVDLWSVVEYLLKNVEAGPQATFIAWFHKHAEQATVRLLAH
jgi:hypothetical protein